jgi:glycosyltransferase involved in cell wall biosynthesis
MSDKPTVSVIIPVYNGERFLAEAIDSVLNQILPPDEIIVVNDGSTDGTAQVVAGLAAVAPIPIRYSYQDNQGPSVARNAGMQIASGDPVAFLDADDLWLPDKLERQLAFLAETPELDYVGCRVRSVLELGQEWPGSLNRVYWESQPPTYTSSALLIRRAAWERVGPFDPHRRLGEDADWIMRARDLSIQAAVVPQVLLIKRIHDQNLTHQAAAMGHDLLRALRHSMRRKQKGKLG